MIVMTRQRLGSLITVLALALVAPGCNLETDGTAGDGADDQVDLQMMLSAVGAADISHGTEAYRAPDGAPRDEREERLFVAFLSGGQEVPAVDTRAEGAMALLLNQHQNRLRFVLQHNVGEATV